MLGGSEPGYVYQRDAHPNADLLGAKCRELHGAESVAVTASGMSALAVALLSQLHTGGHVVLSSMLYGRSQMLFTQEAGRWGITSSLVDPTDLDALNRAITPATKLIVVETISNPRLTVADIAAQLGFSDQAHLTNAFRQSVGNTPAAWRRLHRLL